jgi:hypothetical protein
MPPRIEVYDRVRVTTARFHRDGIDPGALGYVIERYADGALELEFSDPESGRTLATIVAAEADLELAPEDG